MPNAVTTQERARREDAEVRWLLLQRQLTAIQQVVGEMRVRKWVPSEASPCLISVDPSAQPPRAQDVRQEGSKASTCPVKRNDSGVKENTRRDTVSMEGPGVESVGEEWEAGDWEGVQSGEDETVFGEDTGALACSGNEDDASETEMLLKANKLYKDEITFNFTLRSYWLLTEDEVSPDRIPVVRRWISLVNLALASCQFDSYFVRFSRETYPCVGLRAASEIWAAGLGAGADQGLLPCALFVAVARVSRAGSSRKNRR